MNRARALILLVFACAIGFLVLSLSKARLSQRVGRTSPPEQTLDRSSAITSVQEKSLRPVNIPGRQPIDLGRQDRYLEAGLPVPPRGYMGSFLQWKLKHGVPTEDLEFLLRTLKEHSALDREAILHHTYKVRDPGVANALLDAGRDVLELDGTRLLKAYPPAVAGTLGGAATERRLDLTHDPHRTLLLVALEALERLATVWEGHFLEDGWRAIEVGLAELLRSVPRFREIPEASAAVDRIRNGLERHLLTAAEERAHYTAGVTGFRFAAAIADEDTREVFLHLMEHWSSVRKKFWSTPSRPDLAALSHAVAEIAYEGTPAQRAHAATMLEFLATLYQADEGARTVLRKCCNQLARSPDLDPRAKDMLKWLLEGALAYSGEEQNPEKETK